MDVATRADIERWLIKRGTPHLIADYSAGRDVLTRALPFLSAVFVFEMIGALNFEWAWWANVGAALGGLGILGGAWALANRVRGRPLLARPDRVGPAELTVFVLAPPLLPAVFGGHLDDAASIIAVNVLILGFAYLFTSYGVVPMTRWALGRLFRQLGETIGLFTRGLPLLLLAFVFLFINAEVWQVAATLDVAYMWAVVGLFFGLGTLFILTRLPRELAPLAEFDNASSVTALTAGSPAAALPFSESDATPKPSRREWGNVGLVVLFTQGLRVIAASVLMGGFLIAFGLLVMQPETVETWTQKPVHDLWHFELFGSDVVFTQELLRVAVFLAAFSGFYFTVYLMTDPTFRQEFFEDVELELRESFAVRAVYLSAIRNSR